MFTRIAPLPSGAIYTFEYDKINRLTNKNFVEGNVNTKLENYSYSIVAYVVRVEHPETLRLNICDGKTEHPGARITVH